MVVVGVVVVVPCLVTSQGELVSGDQNGNIRVWDLAADACSSELVGIHPRFCLVQGATRSVHAGDMV